MKLFIWVAAGSFIAYILLQWGMDIVGTRRRSPSQKEVIAEVNGEEIARSDYWREIERFSRAEAERLGLTELTEEMMEDIYERVFDALVESKLIVQEVRRRKIKVTDEEILTIVRSSPPQELLEADTFQTGGEFDPQKYQQFIRDPQNFRWLVNYERQIRENFPIQKLQLLVFSAAKITDLQVKKEWIRRNEKVKVEYILIPPDSSQLVEISEDEVLQYYNSHEQDLLEPEKALLSYVLFEKEASEEDEKIVEERIKEVYDDAISGADFTELAEYYSEDPGSAANGGDLGWIVKGTMVKEFEDVVFSLKPGDISEPFRTTFGWHIAKVDKRQRNKVKTKHILLRVVPSAETLENLGMKINEFMEDVGDIGFEEAALKHNIEVYSTGEFPLDREYVPGFGFSREIHGFTMENEVGDVSYTIAKRNRYYIFKIARKKSKTLPDLEKVSSAIEGKIRAEKQKMLAREKASEIYRQISDGVSLRKIAKSNGLKVEKTKLFTRLSHIPDVFPLSEFFGAAFALNNREISTPVETEQGYFIIKVVEKLPADEEEFEEVKGNLVLELLQKEQQQLYTSWIQSLKARAKIKDYRRKLL